MKYIRTKDEIYIQCKLNGYENYYCLKGNMNVSKLTDLDVIKQANTIEELGDRLVCFIQGEYNPYICSVRDIEHLRELEQFGGKIKTNLIYEKIYLAIWTDKGLIYVAKMNEKGELELL